MKCGSEVSVVWDPLLEGNPYKARSALKNTRRRALGSDYATTEAALAPQHAAEVIMTRASKRKKEIELYAREVDPTMAATMSSIASR